MSHRGPAFLAVLAASLVIPAGAHGAAMVAYTDGFGREGGREGIEEYLETKYVAMAM